ncbi:MAG: flagellar assembly protein FliH [Nocardioidaceae bacterium]|jgi:flagellar assembly protein FliH|nr:flagellar assembly protein FliH [Nocardioidaceae bacterium]
MTSTSSDGVVLRGLPVDAVTTADTGTDLRGGAWTRFGTDAVRGDRVTESTLRGLAEQSWEAARAQGYAVGWAEGRRGSLARSAELQREQSRVFDEQGRRALAAQQSAADALAVAAEQFAVVARTVQEELRDQAVDLALQIAAAVLGREVIAAADPGADALRRAVTAVAVDVPLAVRLHPDDLAALDRSVVAGRSVTWTADPSLSRGDAVVETPSGTVDAGIAGALARVREVLGR